MKDLIIALITVTVAAFIIMKKDNPLIENWGGNPSMIAVSEMEMAVPNPKNPFEADLSAVPNTMQAAFFSHPAYQGVIAPRHSGGVSPGAYIRYNMPNIENQAVPPNPLTYGPSMIDGLPAGGLPSCSSAASSLPPCNKNTKENYEPIGKRPSMRETGKSPQMSPYLSNTKEAKMDLALNEGTLKVPQESNVFLDDPAFKDPQQVVVYDRMIFANPKSKLQLGGVDRIRGDIPITATPRGNFDVFPKYNRDLVLGALGTIGGMENETHNEVRALQNKYASNLNVYSDYSSFVNPVLAQKTIGLSGDMNTPVADAFP